MQEKKVSSLNRKHPGGDAEKILRPGHIGLIIEDSAHLDDAIAGDRRVAWQTSRVR
jgi:hypothetical protein